MSTYFKSLRRKVFLPKLHFVLLFMALIYSAGLPVESGADETAQTLSSQAESLLSRGDSTGALQLLDKALELDSKNWEAVLERGRIHLGSGELDAARNDFNRALGSKSSETRARAHIGLGDICLGMGNRAMHAIAEYRLALQVDPASREACFALAQAGMEVGQGKGYRIASRALVKLICLDPCYRDAYTLWHEKILDKTEDELRSGTTCLERYVAGHPEKSTWLLNLAGYRYWLEDIDKALENLARLEQACPDYKLPERLLLQARCLLELGETAGFERLYHDAVNSAEKTGDFHRLALQAEAIFNPAESRKAQECKTAEDWAVFFRKFWKRRDPDPITPQNERLVEHYRRLRRAEKLYSVFNPYPSRFNTSRDYHRLITIKLGMKPTDTGPYDHDPDLFFNRNREPGLDQRGLLYMRHGPPDEIRLPEPDEYGVRLSSAEVWRYGPAFFPFEKVFGAGGDYLFVPLYVRGVGNIEKAMETESFRDPLPAARQEGYWSYFKGPGEQLEVEFYQSAPVATAPKAPDPRAALAVYDTTWTELARDNSVSAEIEIPQGKNWVAVNRVNSMPGHYFFALSMDIPGHRAVMRESIEMEPFSENYLDLSGVILGSPPDGKTRLHSRQGVNILPRPSLRFATKEIITVYFEIYGLEADPEGRRSYLERVTVSLIKEDKNRLAGILDAINPWGKKSTSSLSLTFHRNPPGNAGVVAENFTIDTAELVPGNYSLLIEVLDNSTRRTALTGCFFDLVERK